MDEADYTRGVAGVCIDMVLDAPFLADAALCEEAEGPVRRFFHRVVQISTTRKAFLLVDLAARFVAVSKRVGQAAAAGSSSPSSSAPPALCFVEELVELVTMREQDASLDNRADEMEAPDAPLPTMAGREQQGDGEEVEEKEVQTFPYVRCVSVALAVSATFPISAQSSHIRPPQQHDGALLPRGSLPGRAAASRPRPAPPGALRQGRCRARAEGTNRGLRRLLGQAPVRGVLDLKRGFETCMSGVPLNPTTKSPPHQTAPGKP